MPELLSLVILTREYSCIDAAMSADHASYQAQKLWNHHGQLQWIQLVASEIT
jgi:hypothetical protein